MKHLFKSIYYGQYVRLRTAFRTRVAKFQPGEILRVNGVKARKGTLDLIDDKSKTGNSMARAITGVFHTQVELVDQKQREMLDELPEI
jgi:hypothetical protein